MSDVAWARLGLSPTDDRHQIKRAYAKRLKLTRPDEDPAGFQLLNEAYRECLKYADLASSADIDSGQRGASGLNEGDWRPQPDSELPSYVDSPLSHHEEESLHHVQSSGAYDAPDNNDALPETPLPTQGIEPCDLYAAEVDALIKQAKDTLDTFRGARESDEWQFIVEHPWIANPGFNRELGDALFIALCDHFQYGKDKNLLRRNETTAEVVQTLNIYFRWDRRRRQLQDKAGLWRSRHITALLDQRLDKKRERKRQLGAIRGATISTGVDQDPRSFYLAGVFIRIVACSLDLMLLALVAIVIVGVSGVKVAILFWPFIALCWERSAYQATPGKFVCGLQVTDRNYERIGWIRNGYRIVCALTLITLSTIPLTCFVGLANFFLKGNLLHDRLSGTRVWRARKWRRDQSAHAGSSLESAP